MGKDSELLKKGLLACGIPEEKLEAVTDKMNRYIKEIVLFNSAYNLTNTSDYDELVIRHILDSLAAYKELEEIAKGCVNACVAENELVFADIGSGGGLPGIPLASVFPQYKFKLVERMSKRCAFLENCAAILGLKNVEVINSEAERVAPESFDIAVFRAFRPLDSKMTSTLLRIIKKGGYLAAYKAKMENITEEMTAIKELVPEYEVKPLKVPGLEDSERNLVIIKKA